MASSRHHLLVLTETTAILLGLVAMGFITAGPASADCQSAVSTTVSEGQIHTTTTTTCTPISTGASSGTAQVGDIDIPPVYSGLDSICVATAMSLGEDVEEFCLPPEEGGEEEQQALTPGYVATAFQNTPLPASVVSVQPPNGKTLVNFDTNFFTEAEPYEPPPLVLLGRTVHLRATPSSFTWNFGDGDTTTTTDPGSPYPALDVTHRYLEKGEVSPSVATTWTAIYRVGAGPWQPVPGTALIQGESVDLQVLTATPTLVGS